MLEMVKAHWRDVKENNEWQEFLGWKYKSPEREKLLINVKKEDMGKQSKTQNSSVSLPVLETIGSAMSDVRKQRTDVRNSLLGQNQSWILKKQNSRQEPK